MPAPGCERRSYAGGAVDENQLCIGFRQYTENQAQQISMEEMSAGLQNAGFKYS